MENVNATEFFYFSPMIYESQIKRQTNVSGISRAVKFNIKTNIYSWGKYIRNSYSHVVFGNSVA